ncbi:3-oxoadipate enol-lactonase [Saccharothrix algeriensis]|uniref:3-oxoadipate enol-lactonase n=1 Tax=Saccharothrix algeriensis TaxID=173560 RepID=A0A8T8HVQ9_9PSEU|nr:3-oxoadipate enol-lactonase [Saccharothrix algeriensis]MBM7814198.1 3-oxoadipate enol-lactonase [Saccharothrix algeriensis]QTR02562.1 3-oxoadipate enol-lactonase [Saccharothrix algeriensis]
MRPHHELSGPPGAPVVVLGNSLGTTTALWDPQVAELRERFRVLRYDHRGHGGSPAAPGPYRVADLGGDVLELLDDLGVERFSYCGVSLGAMVGMWLAGHAPERVDRLVLCCTTADYPDPRPWRERAATVRRSGTASIAAQVVGRWFTPALRARSPEVVAAFEAMVSEVDDEGYAACCDALAELDLRPVLPAITAPTAVVAGAQDEATPPDRLRAIAEAIPAAELFVVDGAAHLANVEAADAVSAVLREHLR